MVFQKLNPNQRWRHAPSTTSFDGIGVVIKEDGRVVMSKDDGNEYDEIEVKAGTIFKIAKLLQNTRSAVTIGDEVVK